MSSVVPASSWQRRLALDEDDVPDYERFEAFAQYREFRKLDQATEECVRTGERVSRKLHEIARELSDLGFEINSTKMAGSGVRMGGSGAASGALIAGFFSASAAIPPVIIVGGIASFVGHAIIDVAEKKKLRILRLCGEADNELNKLKAAFEIYGRRIKDLTGYDNIEPEQMNFNELAAHIKDIAEKSGQPRLTNLEETFKHFASLTKAAYEVLPENVQSTFNPFLLFSSVMAAAPATTDVQKLTATQPKCGFFGKCKAKTPHPTRFECLGTGGKVVYSVGLAWHLFDTVCAGSQMHQLYQERKRMNDGVKGDANQIKDVADNIIAYLGLIDPQKRWLKKQK